MPVAYFGDHIVSDVIAAKRHTHWHIGAVVEELLLHQTRPPAAYDELAAAYLRQSEATWGTFVDIGRAAVHVWDELVRKHCDIAVPHLDALTAAGPLATFTGSGDCDGFH